MALVLFVILGMFLLNYNYESDELWLDVKEKIVSGQKLQSNDLKSINNDNFTLADEYFLEGYNNLDEDIPLAKKNFELAIENINTETNEFTKLYSQKFLSDIYLYEGNEDTAIECIKNTFVYLNKRMINTDYDVIEDTYSNLLSSEKGRYIARILANDLLKNNKNISDETKNGLYRMFITTANLSNDYSSTLIYYTDLVNDKSTKHNEISLLLTTVDVAVMLSEMGIKTIPMQMLDRIEDIKLEDRYDNAYFHTYRLLNLISVQCRQGLYEESIISLESLDEYEKHLTIDTENIKNIMNAYINIKQNNLEKATKYIENVDYSNESENLSSLEFNYKIEKQYYYIVKALISEKENDIDGMIKYYEKSFEPIDYKYTTGVRKILETYISLGDKANEEIYRKELDSLYSIKTWELEQIVASFINFKHQATLSNQGNMNKSNIIWSLVLVLAIVIFICIKMIIYPRSKRKKQQNKVKSYLKNNNYKVFYQPIVNMKNNTIVGYEGLLRLEVGGKLILPDELLKDIEECNMMGEVSIWVLKQVIKDYDKIKKIKNTAANFYLSMNISLEEIENEEVFEKIKNIANTIDLKEYKLLLEIVETKKGKDMDKVRTNISKLRELGYYIAIDDFGVDYSNISSLDKFEYDTIKLDKYFIDNMKESTLVQSIITALDYISNKEGKSVVLEGLEFENQKDINYYTTSDNFYVQGYYFCKPIEIEKLIELDISNR